MEAIMTVARWYRWVLLFWCITGLPIYLLGQGMAGKSIFDFGNFIRNLALPTSSLDVFVSVLVPTILIFLPILCLPFAVRKSPNRHGPHGNRGDDPDQQ
jgi:hypothetical protein